MSDPIPCFSLRQLSTFKTVVESGSIRAASRRLGLTSPAITHAMRDLEQSLGASLLHRSVHGIQLTATGHALLARANRVLDEAFRAQEEIQQLAGMPGGQLRIAASAVVAHLFLPETLKAFRELCPGVTVELREVTWVTPSDGWREGEYDFAILAEANGPPRDSLQRTTLCQVPACLAVREGHPAAQATTMGELARWPWLAPGYGMVALAPLFEQCGQPLPRDVIRCYSLSMALTLLRQTDAVAMVAAPLFDDPDASHGLVRLPLQDPLPVARLSVVVRDRQTLTPVARVFLDQLESAAQRRAARLGA